MGQTKEQRAAQKRRAMMRAWEKGKWLGEDRYGKSQRGHPWRGMQSPVRPTDPKRYAKSKNHRLTLEEIAAGGHMGSGHKARKA